MNKSLVCTLILLLVLLTGLPGLAEEKKTDNSLPTVEVETLDLQPTTTEPQVELVATIEPVLKAAIAAKVTGTVTELPVRLGSRVSRGDLLLRISAEEISARVMQAQAQLAQARRNYERERKLLKKKATTPETVKSMKDMLAVAEAAFDEAKTMLGYTRITAPFDGVITRKMVNSGDLATPGTPLLRLENDGELQAVAAVPETLLNKIHEGDLLQVVVPSAGLRIQGTVAEIAPAADPASRTAPVKVGVAHDPALRTGQFARVILPVDQATTLLVPVSAVVTFGQMDKVFVVEEGRARLRLVRTGSRSNDSVEILAGLTPGDRVIISNNKLLVSGQPVTVKQ